MLSKCANPDCHAAFQYLRDGKLYRFDLQQTKARPFLVHEKRPPARYEHFWLCNRCAATMTLTVDSERGVRIRPVRQLVQRATAAAS